MAKPKHEAEVIIARLYAEAMRTGASIHLPVMMNGMSPDFKQLLSKSLK